KAIEKRDIEILTSANTNAILGNDKVEAVRLEDGRTLPADLVVMAGGLWAPPAPPQEGGGVVEGRVGVWGCVGARGAPSFVRWGNVSSIAVSATDWWRRSMTWHGRSRLSSRASECLVTPAPPSPLSSRSRGSMSSLPVIFPKATRRTRSCCAIPRVGSTSAW